MRTWTRTRAHEHWQTNMNTDTGTRTGAHEQGHRHANRGTRTWTRTQAREHRHTSMDTGTRTRAHKTRTQAHEHGYKHGHTNMDMSTDTYMGTNTGTRTDNTAFCFCLNCKYTPPAYHSCLFTFFSTHFSPPSPTPSCTLERVPRRHVTEGCLTGWGSSTACTCTWQILIRGFREPPLTLALRGATCAP